MIKIVLIDDDPISAFVTEKLISKNIEVPFKIFTFLSPLKALEKIEDITPNYLFLDINMPEMTGWDFLEEFQPGAYNPEVYILSSSVDQKDMTKAENYSLVKKYLSKPLIRKNIKNIFN